MNSDRCAVHECEDMPRVGVSVRREKGYLEREDLGWRLVVERQATEGDLEENHHLEELGDVIWTTMVEIRFCPYCGHELAVAQRGSKPDDFGRFVHIDYSAWTSRRC